MHAALNRESVNRPVKTARQQRSDHLARWRIGMNIDRYVQCLGGLKDRTESLIVKIFALGMGIDDCAFKLEPCDRAFKLPRSRLRRLWRHGGERRKAVRMRAHRLAHLIVTCCRKRACGLGLE